MQAGKLRHRVTLQQLAAGSPQQKPTGEPDLAWGDVATVYAAVRPLTGRALFAAQQAQSKVTVEIEIRYRAGVVPSMRAVFQGVVYEIEAVVDFEERHTKMLLQCARGVTEG